MTNILLITNTTDFTADYVVRSLKRLKAAYYRLNTDEIGTSVFLTFDFSNDHYTLCDRPKGLTFDLLLFKSVYFRRPELPAVDGNGLSSEESEFIRLEVRQTLEGLYKILRHAYWMSDVDDIRRAENKIYQQLLAKEIGFNIPAGVITNQKNCFNTFVQDYHNDCIVKPILSGQIGWPEMSRVVFTSKLTAQPAPEQIESCPTYIQERLQKRYDVRVTVVNDTVFAARIHSQDNHETQTDWRQGENILKHEAIVLPDELKAKCLALVNRLNLNFGAIDFVETPAGEFVFLEINPNGQWAWIEEQTGLPISETIAKQLTDEHLS